jgi:hypothetical protein
MKSLDLLSIASVVSSSLDETRVNTENDTTELFNTVKEITIEMSNALLSSIVFVRGNVARD